MDDDSNDNGLFHFLMLYWLLGGKRGRGCFHSIIAFVVICTIILLIISVLAHL